MDHWVVVPFKEAFKFKALLEAIFTAWIVIKWDPSGSVKRGRTQHEKTHKGMSHLLSFMLPTHFQSKKRKKKMSPAFNF